MKKFVLGAMVSLSFWGLMSVTALARDPSERTLSKYCEDPARHKPIPGQQFQGGEADVAVLGFMPGTYKLGDKGAMLYLYKDGSYYLKNNDRNPVTRGTGGDDLMSEGMLGGCSREQLSEALGRNELLREARSVVPVDPNYASTLRVEAEAKAALERAEAAEQLQAPPVEPPHDSFVKGIPERQK